MALDTYAGLKQSIKDHLDRDDLDTYVDDFITLAESRHKRDVRIREMIVRESVIIINQYMDLPYNYLEAKTIRILTDPIVVLKSVNLHELNLRRRETKDIPLFYNIHNQIEFDRTPDQAYSGEIIYYKSLTPLDASNTTNSLLQKAPDVYLYSALAASAPFLLNDERIQIWENLYQSGKSAINGLDRKQIGPLASSVSGPTP